MKTRQPDKKDYIQTFLYLLLFVAVISTGAFLLLPTFLLPWILLIFVSLLLLVAWHRRHFAYCCPVCDTIFEISLWIHLISPHGMDKEGGWKCLRCPMCGERGKKRIVVKVRLTSRPNP